MGAGLINPFLNGVSIKSLMRLIKDVSVCLALECEEANENVCMQVRPSGCPHRSLWTTHTGLGQHPFV